MVQNQAGAPVAPNTLNFQTDPASRASFKGFMTNLNALPNISTPQPAPMASPMPAPMVPAADVDIFQPMPMQMQMGGMVPMSTNIGGLPHMLSYITPGEASVLQDMGGTGQPGPGGVPSFVYDEAGMGFSSPGSPSMGDVSFDYGDNDVVNIGGDDGPEIGPIDPLASGPGADRAVEALAAQNTAKMNALAERNAIDQAIRNTIAATNQQNINKVMSQPDVIAERTELQRGLDQRETKVPRKDALAQQIESVVDNVGPDTSSLLDMDNLGPDTSLLNVDMFGDVITSGQTPGQRDATLAFQQEIGQSMQNFDSLSNAGQVSGPQPRPDMPMSPGFVQPEINVMSPQEREQMAMDELGVTGNTIGGVDQIGVTVGAPSVGPQFSNLGAMGAGAFPEAPISSVSGADGGFGKSTPEQEQIEKSVLDALESRTNINFGTRPKGDSINALEQLGMRAAAVPGTFAGDIASKMPGGIAGIVGSLLGGRAAESMLSDITEKGYIPQYGPDGQIVATINPKTGQFGKGSVESRIAGYTPPEEGNEPGDTTFLIAGGGGGGAPAEEIQETIQSIGNMTPAPTTPTTPPTATIPTPPAQLGRDLGFGYGSMPQVSSGLDNTLNKFFNLLGGFAEGGEVKNFANGGYTDTSSLEGLMEASGADTAAGQAISDAIQSSDGGDSGDDIIDMGGGTQTVIATPVETQTVTAQPMQNQQTAADIIQQQASNLAQSGMQAGQAVGDFFSSLVAPSQATIDATQSMSSLSPQAPDLLNANMPIGGQLTSVPVAAQYADYKPTASGIEKGIQGLSQVGTQRESGFSLPSLPSLSELGQAIMGQKPSYDNISRMNR